MNDRSTTPADSHGPEELVASQAASQSAVEQEARGKENADCSGTGRAAALQQPSSATGKSIDTDVRQFTRADLTRAEQELLDELAEQQSVHLLIPTGTRLDTGNWLMRGKVWAACTEDRLLVFAAGRRPYMKATAFAQLGESLYNHVTGQLVLAPAPQTQVQGLKLSAKAAKSLLARFHDKSPGND